jgi:hypothetical protein
VVGYRGGPLAREARTQAVLHLLRSRAGHHWVVELLQNWTAINEELHGSSQAGLQAALAPMGYPTPLREDLDHYANRLRRDFARDLARTELYVMSPAMADVTVAAAHTLALADIIRLTEDDLPSPAGLLVLPRPLILVNTFGHPNDMRAIAWAPMTVHQPRQPPRRGVRMIGLLDTYGPVENDLFTDMLIRAQLAADRFPPLLVSTVEAMPFGWEHEPSAALLAHVRFLYAFWPPVRPTDHHRGHGHGRPRRHRRHATHPRQPRRVHRRPAPPPPRRPDRPPNSVAVSAALTKHRSPRAFVTVPANAGVNPLPATTTSTTSPSICSQMASRTVSDRSSQASRRAVRW